MRSEKNRNDIYNLYSAVKHAFTIRSDKRKKSSGRMKMKNKYKSIKHGYCKCDLAKCFIFLDKKMKFS